MRIAINRCYGGFSLSKQAIIRMRELGSEWAQRPFLPGEQHKDGTTIEWFYGSDEGIERTDPILLLMIEELGEKANGDCARLKIIIIPDDIDFEILDYDGMESIHEVHRSWR